MATRAEQYRAEDERERRASSAKTKKAKAKTKAKAKAKATAKPTSHAPKKATYAREAHSKTSRPSRKSTRSSQNRSKNDAALVLSQEHERISPERRFRSSKSKTTRVRGKSSR